MINKIMYILILPVIAFLGATGTAQAKTMTKTEEFTVSASGIRSIQFRDIAFTDLTYKGSKDTDKVSVRFERTVKTDDPDKFEDMLSRIDLNVTTSDDVMTIELIHPQHTSSGLLKRLFDRKEWHVVVDITGPEKVNCDIQAGFSEIRTSSTSGTMTVDMDFSSAAITDHTGRMNGAVEFGSLECDGLDGSFDVSSSFGEANLALSYLSGNSEARTSFGSIDIRLPRNTGAVFNVDKSMGSVDFHTSGSLTDEGYKGSRRVLGGGGPEINLDTDFGNITVSDNARESSSGVRRNTGEVVFPLSTNAWWKYESGNRVMTLRVRRTWRDNGRNMATLAFDRVSWSPFESIDVCETGDGLCILGSEGRFYGFDMTGSMHFNTPQLWLPYSGNTTVEGGDFLGTVRSRALTGTLQIPAGEMSDVLFILSRPGIQETSEIKLAPGIGIVSFDEFTLIAYDTGVKPQEVTKRPPPEPRFEEGVVKSIAIRGTRLLSPSDVKELLDIKEGEIYTRREIDRNVEKLEEKQRFIEYANFDIDREGNLSVRITEAKAHQRDWDFDTSFSRIAGVGTGLNCTMTSLIGPISELSGGAQYHWANREWTYNARIEKSFFTANRLSFGGTYRLGYESAMDWAIPSRDSELNAFALGLETKNYHQVEGATGFIAFTKGNTAQVMAEFFEDEYSSLKKHTNWSFFNHRHKKDDNPPLAPMDKGRLTGLRGTVKFAHHTSLVNTGIILEVEHAIDSGSNIIGEYTRLFGNIMNAWWLGSNNILKLRLAGGYSDDFLPAPKAFKLGGINTLRGFDLESVPQEYPFDFQYGGNRMALCNIEYLLGGDDDIGLILFADAGGVWLDKQDFDFADVKRDIGIGVALGEDILSMGDYSYLFNRNKDNIPDGLRINWAVPVGNEPHVSHWTVNLVKAF